MLNKQYKRLAQVIAAMSFIIIFAATHSIQAQPVKIIEQKANLKLLIRDKRSGKPLTKKNVKIYSDNGVRCIQAPCPTNGKTWTGKTDKRGYIVVPNEIRQNSMTLSIAGFNGAELNRSAQKLSKNSWVIALKTE